MAVCPVCNSLSTVEEKCPACGMLMQDAGIIQDYFDDYSAYLGQDTYEDGYRCNGESHCIHLFACPRCHTDVNLAFERVDETLLMD